MKFTIGADPEFFLAKPTGELVSAIGKIGGSKWEPKLISKDGHAILEDNVAVEFNIPPSNNAAQFVQHLNYVLDHLDERAQQLGLVFAKNVASASFPAEELQSPESWVFGCEPDFNAWKNGAVNPKPENVDMTLRSCGGHVHIGTDLPKWEVVKACDLFMGIQSLWLDKDVRRRSLYGNAGACRPKPYGVEYRTLSNFWIWSDEGKEWVYERTQKALEFVHAGNEIPLTWGSMVQTAINKGNKGLGARVCQHYGVDYK